MLADILQTISVVFACFAIVIGVDAWRREFVGKRRIELAEDILALFYEARDTIRYIRNPMSSSDESSSRQHAPNELPQETQALDRAYVAFARYEQNREVFNRLHSLRYRVMARFSPAASEPFNILNDSIGKIFSAARLLGRVYWRHEDRQFRTEEQMETHQSNMEKYEAVFWEGYGDVDPISPAIDKAIQDIEAICRPVIEQKGVGFILLEPFSEFFRRK